VIDRVFNTQEKGRRKKSKIAFTFLSSFFFLGGENLINHLETYAKFA